MPDNRPDQNEPFAVEVRGVRKSFAGVPALRGCNLRVRSGDIHGLLGQNGAGKSTLVKILNGLHPAESFEGEILIRGRPVHFRSPAQARQNGVGYVPQEIEVIEHLSVAENIFTGQTGMGGGIWVNWKALTERAATLLHELGLPFDPAATVALLPPAQRHLIMIARALAAHPAVLIMDEPTASLSEPEIERLFAVLKTLKARGTTIIYITHRLPEVSAICDRVSVMRDGVIADEFERGEFRVGQLVTAMSGRRIEGQFPERGRASPAATLLKVERFSVSSGGRERVREVSFELRAGEILGIAGVLGAGRTELLSAIYGHLPHGGRLIVEGRERTIASPRDARRAGIALLTEDRKRDGLLFNLPLRGNVTIGNLGAFARAGIVGVRQERQNVLQQLTALKVKAPSTEATVAHLSGGNQQKLLFARVLMGNPRVLLLDEPTKGVDVATRQDIYRLIVDLAESGAGLIVVSSELEEVLGLADRCLVMADGRIVDEFVRGEGAEERVLTSIAASQAWTGGA